MREQIALLRRSSVRVSMIVCSCNILSDGQVRACLHPGTDCPRTAAQVYQCLGCSPKCGRCARTIRQILTSALGTDIHVCSTGCATTCPVAKHAEVRRPEVAGETAPHRRHDHAVVGAALQPV